jgi:hypothetical protein
VLISLNIFTFSTLLSCLFVFSSPIYQVLDFCPEQKKRQKGRSLIGCSTYYMHRTKLKSLSWGFQFQIIYRHSLKFEKKLTSLSSYKSVRTIANESCIISERTQIDLKTHIVEYYVFHLLFFKLCKIK